MKRGQGLGLAMMTGSWGAVAIYYVADLMAKMAADFAIVCGL